MTAAQWFGGTSDGTVLNERVTIYISVSKWTAFPPQGSSVFPACLGLQVGLSGFQKQLSCGQQAVHLCVLWFPQKHKRLGEHENDGHVENNLYNTLQISDLYFYQGVEALIHSIFSLPNACRK